MNGDCRFCGEKEDIDHLFLKCSRLERFFDMLKSLFGKFDEDFSAKIFIGGVKYSFSNKRKMCLLNYLIGVAKLAV